MIFAFGLARGFAMGFII